MVVGYPSKPKGRMILEAFCGGAGGTVAQDIPKTLLPGAAAFYGVTPATKHLWEQAKAEERDWYYLDNAYFDGCRQVYFRATRNRLQHIGIARSDGSRLAALIKAGLVVEPKPWRRDGNQIIVAPQSPEFMKLCAGYPGDWVNDTLTALRKITSRTIECRPWTPDKVEQYRALHRTLPRAWAVVTWSSGCAVSGLIEGVPAVVLADDAISCPVAFRSLKDIERRPDQDGRHTWMQIVADQQWTLDEMRSGLCWAMLHA